LDKKRIIELRGKAQVLPATVHVGKEGITQMIIEEIAKQLKKTKLVKIKLLPALEKDRKEAASELAKATTSVLVEVRGRTVVLATE
jgi:RNA-binding protein